LFVVELFPSHEILAAWREARPVPLTLSSEVMLSILEKVDENIADQDVTQIEFEKFAHPNPFSDRKCRLSAYKRHATIE
jgi:hypothetical protein